MLRFESDYLEGAHPSIIKKLAETNFEQTPGYGLDPHCEAAAALIKKECGAVNVNVHFLVGGTQANTTVIASILKAHQGVLSSDAGHIAAHESGAIEATGHKVLTLPHKNGKITGRQIFDYCTAHYADPSFEHTVQPGMVYISNSTEYGTVYTKAELTDISAACREHGLYLFMDGARLGYALSSPGSDLTLQDIAELCDVFYIGGTKVGALFGEAIVISNPAIHRDFRYHIKQHGGMLAKGRLLGIQFEALFETGLYWEISKRAVDLAQKLKKAFQEKGYGFYCDSPSNQQFVIMPDEHLKVLSEKYTFNVMEKAGDGTTVARFCTSWATSEEAVEALIHDIEKL